MGEYLGYGYTTPLDGSTMQCIGKTIERVEIGHDRDDQLFVWFDGGLQLVITNEQSCCESRYWRTDDDLATLRGATLFGFELKEGPTLEEEYDTHEIAFLEMLTTKGSVVFSAHNEHNGYYGGINPAWEERWLEPQKDV